MSALRDFTSARVSVGRTGDSLPLQEVLNLRLAHARAREAVHSALDIPTLMCELERFSGKVVSVRTQAPDRSTYLRRPDLGRRLSEDSQRLLNSEKGTYDAAFVIADGLSAIAISRHVPPVLREASQSLRSDWKLAPIVIVEQGRVAIGDDIGACLGAALVVVLIGERPGLSCWDSLGIYLTWGARPGLTDANRNCISNIHGQGLSYRAAAQTLAFLMNEARRRKISGVSLKEDAKLLAGS